MKSNILKKLMFCVFYIFLWLFSFYLGWNVYRGTDYYVAYWDLLNTETFEDYKDLYDYIDSYDEDLP